MTEAMEAVATTVENPPPPAQTDEPATECSVILGLVDRSRLISVCLEREIKIDPTWTTRVLVAELSAWIHQKPPPEGGWFTCDSNDGGCGGESGADFEACPFCGQGDPPETAEGGGESVTADAKEEAKMNAVEESKPNGKARPAAKKVEAAPKAKPLSKAAAKKAEATKEKVIAAEAPAANPLDLDGLDAIRDEINRLSGRANSNDWRIGQLILRVFTVAMWKERRHDDGSLYWKGFDQWARDELDIGVKYAYLKMDIAKYFTEEQVQAIGFGLATVIVKAPEKSYKRLINECVEKKLTWREAQARVKEERAKGGPSPREKAKNRPAATKGRPSEKITVAAIIGSQPLKFLSVDKKGKKALATKLGSEPVEASFALVNDVVARVKVKLGAKGIVGTISFERVKD